MAKRYVPDRGDLVWLDFDPQAGHEQAGHRPGLVLSPALYNGRSGLALICPITSRRRGYPFEVPLPSGGPVDGVVLSDHVRSADWRSRRAKFIAKVDVDAFEEVRAKLAALIED